MDSLHEALVAGDYEQVCELGRARVKEKPGDAYAHAVLGIGLIHLGEHAAAVSELEHAARLEPKNAGTQFNLGLALEGTGALEVASRAYRAALEIEPTLAAAALNLGGALLRLDDTEAALEAYEHALSIEPGSETAAHMVAALTGGMTAGAPAGYVRQLFDSEAATFEKHLEALDYQTPTRLAALIAERGIASDRVLDLGCGTGLMGACLKSTPSLLVGVDLSEAMIARARARALYDELHVGDVVAAMAADSRTWDLITAADVLVYIGDLAPVFRAARSRLARGGGLAISLERLEEGDVALQPSGRFAHGLGHVAQVATDCGLAITASRDLDLRLERGRPVPGSILILEPGTR